MNNGVVKKAKKNIVLGLFNQLVFMFCPFIERTFIQYALGSKYLGLNSLFSSILTVLSLSELGISSAIVYHMYTPLSENDWDSLNALLNFYKKAYRIIGIVVGTIGLCLVPFLPKLISGSYPTTINIRVLFLIFLSKTVLSYFMYAYLNSLVVVNQREDINSTINAVVKLGLTISQILSLIITKNYYYFALMMPLWTIVNNLWIATIVKKLFPNYKCQGKIPKEKISSIKKLVAGSFVHKACNVTRNSLDSVCISTFLGLTLTAIYNNYFLILTALNGLLGTVSLAFVGGVGLHIAQKSSKDNFEELLKIDFVYLNVSGWATVCLLCLYQPFMEIWMGKEMMFSETVVILFCLYFYFLKLGDMRSMYTVGRGLMWEQRWRSVVETLLNLLLNIILGKFFGVYGIIIATLISLFICNYIWGTRITFKHYFGMDLLQVYYKKHAVYIIVTLFVCGLSYTCCSFVKIDGILQLLVRALICMIIPATIYFIIYHKSEYYLYVLSKLNIRIKTDN